MACGQGPGLDRSLDELERLVHAAGALVAGRVVQRLRRPDPTSYVGRGKVEELQAAVALYRAGLVVADDELTPLQRRHLEQALGVAVLDRTHVILDIFARRARTREGKLQVELAQLTYLLPRLVGWGQTLSRLGGGIGTRGPGETQLESDRRRIKERIARLRRELAELRRHREQQRRGRSARGLASVVLVGYTNAGKSSLLNALAGACVSARDRLFETLDPTVRRARLSDGMECLLWDTVGFIRKLPTHLVAAFRATLEEVSRADLLVHVVDASAQDAEAQMAAVFETLESIGAAGRPMMLAFNKADQAPPDALAALRARYPDGVAVSALRGHGLERLRQLIAARLAERGRTVELELPYSAAGLVETAYGQARVLERSYLSHAVRVRLQGSPSLVRRLVQAGAVPVERLRRGARPRGVSVP